MSIDGSASGFSQSFRLVVTLPDGREQQYPLDGREVTVGRDPSNQIRILHHLVSKFHAKLVRSGPSLSVVDLGSANKTRVNGRVVVNKSLKEGDEIQFAGVRCRLAAAKGADATPGTPRGEPAVLPGTGGARRATKTPPADAAPTRRGIAKPYLSAGVIALFGLVAVLALQVC